MICTSHTHIHARSLKKAQMTWLIHFRVSTCIHTHTHTDTEEKKTRNVDSTYEK